MTSSRQDLISPIRLVAVAAALVAAGAAQAAVAIDANMELDLTNRSGSAAPGGTSSVASGGRVEVNANAELLKNGDNYVTARGTLIVPVDGSTVSVDDAWIKFGNSSVDFKVGQHEAADLFPVAKDTVLEPAAGAGYRANLLRGRVEAGRAHMVVGLNASADLRFEFGIVTQDKTDASKAYGVRPTLVYSAGPLALRGGFESFKVGTVSYKGTGLSAGYAFAADANINLNYARKTADVSTVANASSFGANLVYGGAGIGYVKDKTEAVGATAAEDVSTVYGGYSFSLLGVKGATVTPAISHSSSKSTDRTDVRVRFNYAF
jgi:hypothetical protein